MKARREFRNRRAIEVALLDALVDRADEGMTVFELRAVVDADIDAIEEALAALKRDDLITVSGGDDRVVILPADHVVPDPSEPLENGSGLLDTIRKRLGL